MPARPPARPPHGRPQIASAVQQPTNGRRGAAARGGSRRPSSPHAPHSDPHGSLADRVKNDPALLERVLRDPGLRSQLPDKYLTADQLKTRRNHQMTEDIGDISTPLTGDSLVNTAQTLTDREFDPLLSDLARSEASVRANRDEQSRRAAGYYGGLARQQTATIAGQVAAGQSAVADTNARTAATQGAADQSAAQARQTADHDAAVRGTDVMGGALEQMAADAAAAKQRAGTEGQAAANDAQANNDASAAFLRGTSAATAQAGGEVQGQIAARGDGALGELAASRSKLNADRKGQFTDTLLKMRGNEVDRYLTERGLANDHDKALLDFKTEMANLRTKNQIEAANRRLKLKLTEMGLDQKTAQAEADRATQEAIARGHDETSASNNAASNTTSAANNAASNHQSDVNNRRTNENRGANGGISVRDRRDSADKRDDALTMAQRYQHNRASRETALQLLTEKYGSVFARVAVNAIYDRTPNGHLQNLLKQRYGIDLPRQYQRR